MKKIYWDSCILIYRIQQISPWAEIIARKFAPQMDESLLFATHRRMGDRRTVGR